MASRKTSAEISIRVVEEAAKHEAAYTLHGLHPLSSLAEISDNNYAGGGARTLEWNRWISDGNVPSYYSGIPMGAWSIAMSDENGDFGNNPVLIAPLPAAIKTAGITLTFGGDAWPRQTVTSWYSGTALLATQTDAVRGYDHFIDRGVEGYDKITIEFIGTTLPYRRVKLAEIDFGQLLTWTGNDIIEASVLEEVNLTSAELPLSTMSAKVYDPAEEFNILNPQGIYQFLQQKQRLYLAELINGVRRPMGSFYLEKWDSESPQIATFAANCAIWLLDDAPFTQAAMWSNTPADGVFAEIFAAVGWTAYEIHDGIGAQLLSGYATDTVRSALQQACFALCASCWCGRDGVIHVRRLPSGDTVKMIEKSRKAADGQKMKQAKPVNSVLVTAYSFTPNANGDVEVGGVKYTAAETQYLKEADGLTVATRSQVPVDGIYLISPANGQAVADFVYADYQRRIKQSFTLISDTEQAGDNVDVDTVYGSRKTGVITKMATDMAGGFLAECEVRG